MQVKGLPQAPGTAEEYYTRNKKKKIEQREYREIQRVIVRQREYREIQRVIARQREYTEIQSDNEIQREKQSDSELQRAIERLKVRVCETIGYSTATCECFGQ